MEIFYITSSIILARLIEWVAIAIFRTYQERKSIARENQLRELLNQQRDAE